MTRQEIYNKIFKLLEKEQFHVQNRFEFGEIDLETFEELLSARYNEYQEYVKELALTSDFCIFLSHIYYLTTIYN